MPDIIKGNIHERLKDPEYRDDMSRKVARLFIIQDGHSLATFTQACRRNHSELLDLRPAASSIQEMGLIAAIQNGSHDCVDKLIEMGVNTYHGLGAAFHEAIKNQDFDSFQKLDIEQKAIKKYGAPLLKTATEENTADAIHFLVKSGAKIEECNQELIRTCLEPTSAPIRIHALEAIMHYILSPDFKYLDNIIDHRKRMPYDPDGRKNMVGVVEAEQLIAKSKERCNNISHLHMMRNNNSSITPERAKATCAKMFEMVSTNKPQIPPSIAEQFARMERSKNKSQNTFWKRITERHKR